MLKLLKARKISLVIGVIFAISIYMYYHKQNIVTVTPSAPNNGCLIRIFNPTGWKLLKVACVGSLDLKRIMFKSKAQVADYLGLEYFDPDLQKTTSAVYYQGGGVQVQYEGDLVEAVRVSAKMIEPSIDKILEYLNVKIDANNLKYTKTDASYSFEIPIGSKSVYCSAAINPQSKAIDNIVCSAVNR